MNGDLAAVWMGAAGAVLFLGYRLLRMRRQKKEREQLLKELQEGD